jgi:hypothetical protein
MHISFIHKLYFLSRMIKIDNFKNHKHVHYLKLNLFKELLNMKT